MNERRLAFACVGVFLVSLGCAKVGGPSLQMAFIPFAFLGGFFLFRLGVFD
jgi:hypothetical protein